MGYPPQVQIANKILGKLLNQGYALSLPLVQKGKVRDIYDIDEYRLLIVTTDRLSAFDVVFNQPIYTDYAN
jgi:phosphoribosylaminoimidazole-succinocarboxamide synthase